MDWSDRSRVTRWRRKLVLVVLWSLAAAPVSALPMYVHDLGPAELGAVSPGSPVAYSHHFDVAGATVVSAMLAVVTVDQPGCLLAMPGSPCDLADFFSQPEVADIDVGGSDFATGAAGLGLFVGDVTDLLVSGGGVLDVVAASLEGDFHAWRSLLLVAYEPAGGSGAGGGAPAIPEPGAAVLFGLGTLLMGRASRRS